MQFTQITEVFGTTNVSNGTGGEYPDSVAKYYVLKYRFLTSPVCKQLKTNQLTFLIHGALI